MNMVIAAAIISACTAIAEKRPGLAGLLVALPVATLTSLALTQVQSGDGARALLLAKRIFLANVLTLTMFIPYLLAHWLRISFWQAYLGGIAIVLGAYSAHHVLFEFLFG